MRTLEEHEKNSVRQFYMYYLTHPLDYLARFSSRRIVFLTYRWKRQIEKDRKEKKK